MTQREIEDVTSELRRFVSWPTQNVAASLPALRALVRAADESSARTGATLFEAILRLLTDTIEALEGVVSVLLPNGQSVTVDARSAKTAYKKLFWLAQQGGRPSHEQRRSLAILALGLDMTVSHWRRDGPEVAFLALLAQRMVRAPESTPRYAHESFDLSYVFDDKGHLVEVAVFTRLRALSRQVPRSSLTLVMDAYPGHRFTLEHLAGCEVDAMPVGLEGLPLQLRARGPAVNAGDVLTVSTVFAVESSARIGYLNWYINGETRQASVRVQFHPAAVPSHIWHYRDAPTPEKGMVELASAEPVLLEHGAGYHLFASPARRSWLGLFWQWP